MYFFVDHNYDKTQKVVNIPGHTTMIRNLLISENDEFIFSVEDSNKGVLTQNFIVWKVNDREEFVPEITQMDTVFSDFKCSKNKFIGVNFRKEIQCWDPVSVKEKRSEFSIFNNCAYSPKGDFLISIIANKKIALINEKTGLISKCLTLENKEEVDLTITSFSFSQDGIYVILSSKEFLYIYEVNGSNKLAFNPISIKSSASISLIIMSQGGIIITGHQEGEMMFIKEKKTKIVMEKEHTGTITAFAFDSKEEVLASGDEEGKVCFWNKEFKKIKDKEIKNEGAGNSILYLLFSKLINGILFVLYKYKLEIYNLKENKVVEKVEFGFESRDYYFMSVSNDESLIYMNSTNAILILQKVTEKYQIVRKFTDFKDRLLEVRPHTTEKNSCIANFTSGIFEVKNIIEKMTYEVKGNLFQIRENTLLVFPPPNNQKISLQLINSKTGAPLFSELKEQISENHDFLLSSNEKCLLVKDYQQYWVWDLDKGEIIETRQEKEKGWIYQTLEGRQKKGKMLVAFAKATQDVFLWESKKSPFEKNIFHYNNIRTLDFSFDDTKLLVVCFEKTFILDTNNDFKIEKEIQMIEDEITTKGLFSCSNYKIYLDVVKKSERTIKIYDGSDGSLIKTIKPLYQFYCTFLVEPSADCLLFVYQERLSLCQLADGKEKVICSRKTADRSKYYLNQNSDLYIYENNKYDIYYKFMENSTLFLENRDNLQKLINRTKDDKEDDDVANNFYYSVCPFGFNVVQIFAYAKEYMHEKNVLGVKGLPMELFFTKDLHMRNCFDIVTKTEESNLFTKFLSYILENTSMQELRDMDESYDCFDTDFFKKLMMMFEDNPKLINSFLDFIFTKPIDFPENFTFKSLKQPILTAEEGPVLDEDKVNEITLKNSKMIDEKASMKEVLNAKCLYCNSFLDYNNEATIDVFKGISQFEPTNDIFSHIALIKLLDYKWENYARRIYFLEALSFFLFLALYLLNANYLVIVRFEDEASDEQSDIWIYSLICDFLIICFVMNNLYLEIQQLISLNFADYFSSLWNNIDVILIILCFFTTIFDILSCIQVWQYPMLLKTMHSFTIFFGYLRILSYASGIEGSSFMIKLIIQVIYDIRYFLFLMFIFIVALTSSGNYLYFTRYFNHLLFMCYKHHSSSVL